MEYKVLNEKTMENIKNEFESRSAEWDLDKLKVALMTYEITLDKLYKTLAFKKKGVELYMKDASLANPTFNYEKDIEYAEMLREIQLIDLNAELQKLQGQIESTEFQIPLMKEKINNYKIPSIEVVEEVPQDAKVV